MKETLVAKDSDPEDVATKPAAGSTEHERTRREDLKMGATRNATPSRVLYDEDLQFIIDRLAEATGDPELLRDEPDGECCGWIVTHPSTGELGFSSLSVHDHPGLVPVEPVSARYEITFT